MGLETSTVIPNLSASENPLGIITDGRTDLLRDRATDLAGCVLEIIKIGQERLGGIKPNHPEAPTIIQNYLSPVGYPDRLIAGWKSAEEDLSKLFGALVNPTQIGRKISEFLVPLDPFTEPAQASYYLGSFGGSLRRLTHPDNMKEMGDIQPLRVFVAGRIFEHGFFKRIWLSRPKDGPIQDSELEDLVLGNSRELPNTHRQPRVWWTGEIPETQSTVYTQQEAVDLNQPTFQLARLERFLKLRQAAPSELPGWERHASQAVFSALGDCINEGLETQAQELIRRHAPPQSLPTINQVLEEVNSANFS